MATLGAFTALYGSGRPYLSRARLLSTLACCFALAVWLGGECVTDFLVNLTWFTRLLGLIAGMGAALALFFLLDGLLIGAGYLMRRAAPTTKPA